MVHFSALNITENTQNFLISQNHRAIFFGFYNISQPNFAAILLILGCSIELYFDIFRLSCLDKKLVDSWNHPLLGVWIDDYLK